MTFQASIVCVDSVQARYTTTTFSLRDEEGGVIGEMVMRWPNGSLGVACGKNYTLMIAETAEKTA